MNNTFCEERSGKKKEWFWLSLLLGKLGNQSDKSARAIGSGKGFGYRGFWGWGVGH